MPFLILFLQHETINKNCRKKRVVFTRKQRGSFQDKKEEFIQCVLRIGCRHFKVVDWPVGLVVRDPDC